MACFSHFETAPQNRRSLADKAGDEQRQIHNQQENDDQTDEVGDDGLGQALRCLK